MHRKIGQFGGKLPGALVFVIGALHGNEPSGVFALQEVFGLLEQESASNRAFTFHGKLVGCIGNMQALEKKVRFIEKDLNRIWSSAFIHQLLAEKDNLLLGEDREVVETFEFIRAEIEAFPSKEIVFLDLHSTSADGGIFSIPTDETGSLDLARELHVPVILRLQDSIEGPLLKFAAAGHFNTGTTKISAIAFEAGQHDDPQSVKRSAAAIVRCLYATGCCKRDILRKAQEGQLQSPFQHMPPVVLMRHVHHIHPEDHFRMRPGYLNFQKIRKGEHLADDVSGPIHAPIDGMILMPLYQPTGSDGFFIVQ